MAAENPRADESAAAPRTPAAVVWLAPLLSGALLYLSFFPVACGWLAWVALVPLLCLVRVAGRPRGLHIATWLGGLGFFVAVLQWMRVADPRMVITWLALAVYCSLYVPVALALVRRLDRRTGLPLPLTLPAAWVSLEYLRYGAAGSFVSLVSGSHHHDWPGGFSWYFLGQTQHDFLTLAQVADLTGVYGVSALLCAANALLFEALYSRPGFRHRLGLREPTPRPRLRFQAAVFAVLLVAVLGYGAWRLSQDTMTPGPRVALLQSNADQRLRNQSFDPSDPDGRDRARREMAANVEKLALVAATHRPGLIVWPETSYPAYWVEMSPGRPHPKTAEMARLIGRALGTPQLLGMSAEVLGDDGKERKYNSAILIAADGRRLGRYDKVHRVPFGEYVPLLSVLPFLKVLSPYNFDYAVESGEEFTRFALDGARPTRFGVVICYEDTDPAIARAYLAAAAERPVDFLVNISNDGWFDGTSEHDQHMALARFRAIECRRSLVRAVNMGISGVIDANGRVLAPNVEDRGDFFVGRIPDGAAALPVSRWGQFKKVPGVIVATVPIDTRSSLYATWGDVFAWCCAAFAVLAVLETMTRPARAAVTSPAARPPS